MHGAVDDFVESAIASGYKDEVGSTRNAGAGDGPGASGTGRRDGFDLVSLGCEQFKRAAYETVGLPP